MQIVKSLSLFQIIVFAAFVFAGGNRAQAQSSVTVKLPPARPVPHSHFAPACSRALTPRMPPSQMVADLACAVEKAKYKCKSKLVLRGIGSCYGSGDEFTGGKTACEKPFKPRVQKVLALQDSILPPNSFRPYCGKKAVVVAYNPETGRCKSSVLEVSDTGNLGARDPDGKPTTRDSFKNDFAFAGERKITGPRLFDLSYAAASALGYVGDSCLSGAGKAYMEVEICDELYPGGHTWRNED